MSISKKITVNYHFLESTDNSYFNRLTGNLLDVVNSSKNYGTFDTMDSCYLWKIEDKIEVAGETFIISLAKTKQLLPSWFNNYGYIKEIPKNEGMIGELFYAFINPKNRFMISVAATSGSAVSSFKHFLNELSLDTGVICTPLFEKNVDKLVVNWGFYKRLSLSLNFPLNDDLAEFLATREGEGFALLDKLGGLKAEITISNSKPKHTLEAYAVREFLSSLIDNELCGKLKIAGGDFDNETLADIDLKNAIVKYKETVVINGSFLSLDYAKSMMLRAYNERASDLILKEKILVD